MFQWKTGRSISRERVTRGQEEIAWVEMPDTQVRYIQLTDASGPGSVSGRGQSCVQNLDERKPSPK